MHQGSSTVGEINATSITREMFRVYGQQAYVVVGTSAIIQAAALVASIVAFNVAGPIAGPIVWLLLTGVAYQLSMGVFTKLLLHLRHGHDVPSPGYLLREASAHLVPLLWLGILVFFGTLIGFMLLVVPGIYLTLRWAVASPALVARNVSAVEALRVSGELTRGHMGTVWLLAVIAGFFTNGIPRIIEATQENLAMENLVILNAVVAAFATPIVALATAELFLRLAGVPDQIVPGMPLGGPAPAPAGPFVPTAAIPAQQAPGPYVPQPAPAAGFAPAAPVAAHAFAPPQAPAHAFAPPQAYAPPAAPQAYAPPAAPQAYAPQHPAPAATPQAYMPPAAPQAYAPPAYIPPAPPAAPAMRQGPSIAPPGLR